jgi:CheY-like chemotaxis protein
MVANTRVSVLIVDDHADSRELVREWLSNHGYEVIEASDGSEALKILASMRPTEPRLIILDLEMPTMTGWQFLAVAENDEQLARIPVLVTSGSRDLAKVRRHSSVVDYLKKPVDLLALLSTVERHAGKHRAPENA